MTGSRVAPTQVMVSFIDDHRAEYGVEPIFSQLPIAPSTAGKLVTVPHPKKDLPAGTPHKMKKDAGL